MGFWKDLFSEEGFAFFRQEVRRVLAERRKETCTQADRVQTDLRRVEAEIVNVLRAIKAGV